MPNLGKLLGIPENRRSYEESELLALKKCYTGLEFEAEGVKSRLPTDADEAGFWLEKEDGSLRGASMEYVLREPLFGQDLVSSVRWLCEWATKERLEANYRTGLHVHIDVRNLDPQRLITMLIYYSLFEKVIFEWVGDHREGSNFCMPFYKAEGVLEPITRALKAETQMKDYAAGIERYAAFNLNSLSRFGTVEWRHMQTTFNFDKVMKWINIAQGFKKYAKANPMQPKELLAELSSMGPDRIFAGIVGPAIASELWKPDSYKHVTDVGIPIAQEIATLLEGAEAVTWNSVRKAIGSGENPRWQKWSKKYKETIPKVPENPFTDPESLIDPEIQKAALQELGLAIRAQLDSLTISS